MYIYNHYNVPLKNVPLIIFNNSVKSNHLKKINFGKQHPEETLQQKNKNVAHFIYELLLHCIGKWKK